MGLFDGFLGPVLGGAIGLVSNAKTNAAQRDAAADANAFTATQLQKRHQWEVADLKAAGLNPILSAGGTPSIGSSAKADVESSGEAISRSVSSALAAKALQSQIDLNQAQTTKNYEEARFANRNTEVAFQTQKSKELENFLLAGTIPASLASAKNVATEQNTWLNRVLRPRSKAFADTVGDFTGAIGNVFRGQTSRSNVTYGK